MTEEYFKGLEVTDQYGEKVIIEEIVGNTAFTNCGGLPVMYHTFKLSYKGKTVYEHLNSKNNDEQ